MYNFSDYDNINIGNLIIGYEDDDDKLVYIIKKYNLKTRDEIPKNNNLIEECKSLVNENRKFIVLYETIKISNDIGTIISGVDNNNRYIYVKFLADNALMKMTYHQIEYPIEHNWHEIYRCAFSGRVFNCEDLVLLDKHIVHKDFVKHLKAIKVSSYYNENYRKNDIEEIINLVNIAHKIKIKEAYTTEPIYDYVNGEPCCIMANPIIEFIQKSCSFIYDYNTNSLITNYRIFENSSAIIGDDTTYIKPYDYVPSEFIIRDLTKGSNNKDIYTIGLEIEVECPKKHRKRISYELIQNYGEKEKLFYVVYDGSLKNGVELVTMPFKVNRHTGAKDIVNELSKTLKYMNTEGNTYAANTCGLHIHVGRNCLNRNALAKIQYMFDLWWDDLLKFSGRPRESSYAQQLNAMLYTNKKNKLNCIRPILCGARKEPSKYFCVNTLHNNTIEIRLWQGTQNAEVIEAMIEMTMILFNIARHKTINEIHSMDFKDIYKMSNNKSFKKIFKERNL